MYAIYRLGFRGATVIPTQATSCVVLLHMKDL